MNTSDERKTGKGVWTDVRVTGLYTLSPLHVGVGQVAGAVDQPVAREAGTGFPLIPASGLKGAARAFLRGHLDQEKIGTLFGPDLGNDDKDSGLAVGLLTFTEARLIAYPVRSLNQPFFYATCPSILDRWQRDLRLVEVNGEWSRWAQEKMPEGIASKLAVTNQQWAGIDAMVLEDLVYEKQEIDHYPWLAQAAKQLATLLPPDENYTQQQFQKNFVCLPDADFADLMARVIPVRARTQLTDGKTTDKWVDPVTNKDQRGNLWYEEYIPGDSLFVSLVGQRRRGDGSQKPGAKTALLADIDPYAENLQLIQIGGNETVGYGLCSWNGWKKN